MLVFIYVHDVWERVEDISKMRHCTVILLLQSGKASVELGGIEGF